MTIEDLFDTGAFTAYLEKFDRVSCDVGRHSTASVRLLGLLVFSTCTVTKKLQERDGEFECRVRSANEPYERVVRESDLGEVP